MSSGRRTNLPAICKRGILFSCVLWLRTFLHRCKAPRPIPSWKKALSSCLLSLLSSLASTKLKTNSSPPVCYLALSAIKFTQLYFLFRSCPGLISYDWVGYSRHKGKLYILWKYPSFQAADKKLKKKLLRTWNRWSRPALLQELGQTLLFPNSCSKYTSPTCPFLDGTSLV